MADSTVIDAATGQPIVTPNQSIYGNAGYSGTVVDTGIAQYAEPQYYRDKITEFQTTMNAVAATADQMSALVSLPDLDDATRADVQSWLDDFASKKTEFTLAAEAINVGAQTANAAGLTMPVLAIPAALGFAPLAIAALAAAIAAAAYLISWGLQAIANAQATVARIRAIQSLPPDQQAVAIAAEQGIAAAAAKAQSPLSSIANVVKWIAIGAAIYFGFQAFKMLRT